jgi:transcription elongation factor Elf1
MESVYDKVVKLTAEILKSWKSDPGVVSPFSSSSSSHAETNDNHLEYYVKQGVTSENSDIASMFNSDLFTNGGEKMTEKTLDVNSSETTQNSYTNPGSTTTEPDAQSEIAITKSVEIPTTHVGTTANTTEQAPSKGETTEPMEKAADCPDCGKPMTMCMCDGMSKAENCPKCNKSMTMCMCDGMNKAAAEKCPHCGQSMPMEKTVDGAPVVSAETAPDHEAAGFDSITKAEDEKESAEEEASESKEDEEKEMKKSIWGGAFAPSINGRIS